MRKNRQRIGRGGIGVGRFVRCGTLLPPTVDDATGCWPKSTGSGPAGREGWKMSAAGLSVMFRMVVRLLAQEIRTADMSVERQRRRPRARARQRRLSLDHQHLARLSPLTSSGDALKLVLAPAFTKARLVSACPTSRPSFKSPRPTARPAASGFSPPRCPASQLAQPTERSSMSTVAPRPPPSYPRSRFAASSPLPAFLRLVTALIVVVLGAGGLGAYVWSVRSACTRIHLLP